MEDNYSSFQDLQWVSDRAIKEFNKLKTARPARLFKEFRLNPHFSLFGDYSIMWAISKTMDDLKIKKVRQNFKSALRYSKEYKELKKREKMWWLNTLSGEIK